MPFRKKHKKDFTQKTKDQIGETMHHGKSLTEKEKYKHKRHWIEQEDDEDDDYNASPNNKEEEEEEEQ